MSKTRSIRTAAFPTREELASARKHFGSEAIVSHVVTSRRKVRTFDWRPTGDIGATLLFIHGMADSPESFCLWMKTLTAQGIRCLAYDLPCGRDGSNLGSWRHAHFTEDLLELLDHWQLEQVDLLGSSFGSTIALRTAALCGSRVRRLILQGGFARRPLRRLERGLCRVGRYWPWLMNELILREQVMTFFDGPAFQGCPPELFQFLLESSGRTPARAAARRTLIIDKLDLRPLLHRISHPVLMIGGDRDTIVPVVFQDEVEQGLPNVQRIEYQPCGHYPQYTMPQASALAIAEFLR